MSVYDQLHQIYSAAVVAQNHTAVVGFLQGLRWLSAIIVPRGWAVDSLVPGPAGPADPADPVGNLEAVVAFAVVHS